MTDNAEVSGIAGQRWRWIRWCAALLLAGITGWLTIRQIDWGTFKTLLARPRLGLLVLALGTVLVTTAAKSVRWQILLRRCSARAGTGRIVRVLLIGQMANSLVPRLGDAVRAALIGPVATGGAPAAFGTVLVEKLLDGIMGLLLLIGLALWAPLPVWLRGPVLGLASLTGGLLAVLVLAAARLPWADQVYRRLISWLPGAIRDRATRLPADFGLGLSLLRQPRNALLALAWSFVVWGLAASTNVLTLAALDITAPAWTTWLVLVSVYTATFLPTVPAQIGVYEYACLLALTASGVDREPALAFGLALHFLVYAPPAILGAIGLVAEGVSWAGLREAGRKAVVRRE